MGKRTNKKGRRELGRAEICDPAKGLLIMAMGELGILKGGREGVYL